MFHISAILYNIESLSYQSISKLDFLFCNKKVQYNTT